MIRGNTHAEGKEIQIVCFRLCGREYGVPILQVKEIVKLERVIDIPELGKTFAGVINLRGQLIPLVDLRNRFGGAPPDETIPKALILKMPDGEFLGAVVNDISEIISLPETRYLALTAGAFEGESKKVSGIVEMEDGRSIIIMKVSAILDAGEFEKMKEDIKSVRAEGGAKQ